MLSLSDFNGLGEEIERRMLLRTSPISLKLLETKNDIPEGAVRPKRDLGFHLGLCQAFAMSRWQRKTVAMLKEDHWCYLPVIAIGLAEPPELFLQGNTFFGFSVGDLKAVKNLAKAFPRLERDKYLGIVSSPLSVAQFEPEVVHGKFVLILCLSHVGFPQVKNRQNEPVICFGSWWKVFLGSLQARTSETPTCSCLQAYG